jgi:hypothetical protein
MTQKTANKTKKGDVKVKVQTKENVKVQPKIEVKVKKPKQVKKESSEESSEEEIVSKPIQRETVDSSSEDESEKINKKETEKKQKNSIPVNLDWKCSKCGLVNPSTRYVCYTCKTSKSKDVETVARMDTKTKWKLKKLKKKENERNAPIIFIDEKKNWTCECGERKLSIDKKCKRCNVINPFLLPKKIVIKRPPRVPLEDDWKCPRCKNSNSKKFKFCSKCQLKRKFKTMDGEWDCSGCQLINFAKRTSCLRCKKPKDGEKVEEDEKKVEPKKEEIKKEEEKEPRILKRARESEISEKPSKKK